MKIGLLADTHNNLANTLYCLDHFRQLGIGTVIHCGDLTDDSLITKFDGFRLIYTYGNCDKVTSLIDQAVQKLGNQSRSGPFFEDELGGKQVFAVHGDIDGMISAKAQSQHYHYIFHGHTHRRADYIKSTTRIINPGALGGVNIEARSFATLDLATDTLKVFQLKTEG